MPVQGNLKRIKSDETGKPEGQIQNEKDAETSVVQQFLESQPEPQPQALRSCPTFGSDRRNRVGDLTH